MRSPSIQPTSTLAVVQRFVPGANPSTMMLAMASAAVTTLGATAGLSTIGVGVKMLWNLNQTSVLHFVVKLL